MDQIYDTMISNNIKKINENGFNYDEKLMLECDKRYCYAIFAIPNKDQTHFTNTFYNLLNDLSKDTTGITYHSNNNQYNRGTFHFTFMQQLTFNNYYDLPKTLTDKYHNILSSILKKHLPFIIKYNKLIMVPNGLILCGDASININQLRDEYRKICNDDNLLLIEPYYLNIIHSTLFRLTKKVDNVNDFINKYEKYINKEHDFGYVIIDHFNLGKATWKVNQNEIIIEQVINI
jgi:hypothetical protein